MDIMLSIIGFEMEIKFFIFLHALNFHEYYENTGMIMLKYSHFSFMQSNENFFFFNSSC